MPGLTMIMTPETDSSSPSAPAMPLSEVADRIASMQHQESTTYQCGNYMDAASSTPTRRKRSRPSSAPVIDRDCRTKMVEWCYHVGDFCKFRRETVSMATSYMDRFLCTSHPRAALAMEDKKEFQLLAMTCLYVSIKLFEPLAMDAGLLAQISHGCYEEDDILAMEQELLTGLGWRLNGPTSHAFLEHVFALLPASAYGRDENTAATILDFSRFQAEIAVGDYDLSLVKPSTVAMAALINSIEGVEKTIFPAQNRFHFFRFIQDATGLNPFSLEVNTVRARLLELFTANSGYELPQIANLTPIESPRYAEKMLVDEDEDMAADCRRQSSPVSVARHFESGKCTYGANCA